MNIYKIQRNKVTKSGKIAKITYVGTLDEFIAYIQQEHIIHTDVDNSVAFVQGDFSDIADARDGPMNSMAVLRRNLVRIFHCPALPDSSCCCS